MSGIFQQARSFATTPSGQAGAPTKGVVDNTKSDGATGPLPCTGMSLPPKCGAEFVVSTTPGAVASLNRRRARGIGYARRLGAAEVQFLRPVRNGACHAQG